MSMMRAGGLTTLILTLLTTAALTGFGEWYTSATTGELAWRTLMWGVISLFVTAPVCIIIFPLVYTLLGLAGRPGSKVFAVLGGVIGAAIAGYAIFRFRSNLAVNPGVMFIALPLLVFGATLLGVIGGFLFERMARRAPQLIPPISDFTKHEEPLPPLNKDDLPKQGGAPKV